jgi:hypothetical protein
MRMKDYYTITVIPVQVDFHLSENAYVIFSLYLDKWQFAKSHKMIK